MEHTQIQTKPQTEHAAAASCAIYGAEDAMDLACWQMAN
jgi:hypothetical protein